jgi:mRNA-degrading endonuclease toxin of MazEF toxin-antitoxin module
MIFKGTKFGRFVHEIDLIITFPKEGNEYIVSCNDKNGNNILGADGVILCEGIDSLVSVIKGVEKTLSDATNKERNDEIRTS